MTVAPKTISVDWLLETPFSESLSANIVGVRIDLQPVAPRVFPRAGRLKYRPSLPEAINSWGRYTPYRTESKTNFRQPVVDSLFLPI